MIGEGGGGGSGNRAGASNGLKISNDGTNRARFGLDGGTEALSGIEYDPGRPFVAMLSPSLSEPIWQEYVYSYSSPESLSRIVGFSATAESREDLAVDALRVCTTAGPMHSTATLDPISPLEL